MPFTKRLLVVFKPDSESSSALNRGALIAERLGLELELLLAVREPSAEQHDRLRAAQQSLQLRGLRVSAHQQWCGSLHETVLQRLNSGRAGLLVKEADQSPRLEGLITPADWKLMRFAPCPVLLVKQPREWGTRPVLAAVDANPHDGDHQALNRLILLASQQITLVTGGPLHLVSAYSSTMQAADAQRESADAKAERYRQACQALCAGQGVTDATLHIGEGPVESWVAQTEQALDAAVVVMGTVARSGMQALLMGGNTAESILSRLRCDILTLKPEGSESLLPLLFQQE